jgi:hypothetical protein
MQYKDSSQLGNISDSYRLIRSHYFELKSLEPTTIVSNGSNTLLPKFNSFLVIDGNQVLYENINHGNPEEFTIAIARYDDTYLADQFISYWKLLKGCYGS